MFFQIQPFTRTNPFVHIVRRKKLEYKTVYPPPKRHSIFKLWFLIDDFDKKGIEFDLFLKFIFTIFDQVYHDDSVNLI